ncbi:ANTAR domain-containing protein [Streptomyces sp. NPDC005526]|uniref:ANTAR domain-containing protein n=1 Tax=Streptomyces sp. NPDC005526 TaxID=3156885 RepID=UPI0033BC25F7
MARLRRENAELRQAADSHAKVDQAIGVLVATRRIRPAAGFDVLREDSRRTDVKLHTIAKAVIAWALGRPLPESVGRELAAAVERRSPHQGVPDRPG